MEMVCVNVMPANADDVIIEIVVFSANHVNHVGVIAFLDFVNAYSEVDLQLLQLSVVGYRSFCVPLYS
ncbi:hypothetical protein T03_5435, partial [Trichinella britovi]